MVDAGANLRCVTWRFGVLPICVELIFASFAVVHSHGIERSYIKPASVNMQQSAKAADWPAAAQALPSAKETLTLVRTTLLSYNDAIKTGNFTVMRDLAAPSFQRLSSIELSDLFARFGAAPIDLSPVAVMTPILREVANVGDQNRLRISGYFSDLALQIDFVLLFENVAGQWRLFGISVKPVEELRLVPRRPSDKISVEYG